MARTASCNICLSKGRRRLCTIWWLFLGSAANLHLRQAVKDSHVQDVPGQHCTDVSGTAEVTEVRFLETDPG